MLYGGSTGQLNGGANGYLPDYSVRQLTHLQIIKVTSQCHVTRAAMELKFVWFLIFDDPLAPVRQISRSHYQNAVAASRMDTSPQTPDADTRLAEDGAPTPEPQVQEHPNTLMPPGNPVTLMPPREPGRPGSARTRAQQSGVSHSTSMLNERNRIVRKYRTFTLT